MHTIELKLREVSQFFNSMDPSPFHEKDLDHDAEEFIVSWAQEYPSKAPLKLRVNLEQWPASDPTETITRATRHYFAYRAEIGRMEFKHLMKQARLSLTIGALFLAACLFTGSLVPDPDGRVWSGILKEGLTIMGWVAMWRPLQMYLYDWWPVLRQIGIYDRLSRMPVEVVKK